MPPPEDVVYRVNASTEEGPLSQIESASDELPPEFRYGVRNRAMHFTYVRPGTELRWLIDVPPKLLIFQGNIAEIPTGVWGLPNLEDLHLLGTGVHHVPPEIGQLTSLKTLLISHSSVEHLPSEIGRLTKLRHLVVTGCGLLRLPAEIGDLSSLVALDLHNNTLTELPEELANLPNSINLGLAGNPLRQPYKQLVEQGTEALFVYLRSLKADGMPQYEAKVLLVGEGNVGKTSLVAALQGGSSRRGDPPPTALNGPRSPCTGGTASTSATPTSERTRCWNWLATTGSG